MSDLIAKGLLYLVEEERVLPHASVPVAQADTPPPTGMNIYYQKLHMFLSYVASWVVNSITLF